MGAVVTARVKVNRRVLVGYLKGDGGVAEDLKDRAARIAAAAGEGMETDYAVGRNRARASVRTATFAAMRAEAKDRALSRALDAGR